MFMEISLWLLSKNLSSVEMLPGFLKITQRYPFNESHQAEEKKKPKNPNPTLLEFAIGCDVLWYHKI
jgi:hypothetical protein